MNTYRTIGSRGVRYYTAQDGSRRRIDDPDRHRLTRREKKAQRRARTIDALRKSVERG